MNYAEKNELKQSDSHESGAATLTKENAGKSTAIEIPSISLPKGGGAIKSIDEKFSVNAANGTASFSIPLPFSPSRNAFLPALGLNYNSGTGNSIFGIGWGIDVSSITRKTEKELPQYFDAEESDTFIFSGVEDLVPVLTGLMEREIRSVGGDNYYPYRPRIESDFSRIERVIEKDNNCYWKVTTKENITSVFGRSANARIADPKDHSKVFKWLLEFSYDDKGNCYRFEYKPEDLINVPDTLHEGNRLNSLSLVSNTYLKSIKYCNAVHFDKNQPIPDWKSLLDNINFLLELVLDYGEHDKINPRPDDNSNWYCRKDPWSDYRPGFEIRTYRLCQRILMFHLFDELGKTSCLVRSLDFSYSETAVFTFLQSITQNGYKRDSPVTYVSKSFPPFNFTYESLGWNTEVKSITAENITHAPAGIDDKNYQWIDLYSEGVSGILTEQANVLFYKSNRGNGEFSVAELVAPKPTFSGLSTGAVQLSDIEANGKKYLVSHEAKGFFEMTAESEWLPFKNFLSIPNINWQDPNLKLLDLNGDGLADILISEENVFVWYAAKGKAGYADYRRVFKPLDEEKGPAIVFADITQSIVLADMSGDGLTDIVRIRNGEIVYWPNLGYGKFGPKVAMSDAPVFDAPDVYNSKYIRLADLDGSGSTDIIYLGKNSFQIYFNQSGNSWNSSGFVSITNPLPFPAIDDFTNIDVIDLLGNGTGCITWSSPLPNNAPSPLKYIDLMGGRKPHIMNSYSNNIGKQVNLSYKSSTSYYLNDKKSGKPWITKLPFPVQCVDKVETIDLIAKTRFTNEYSYRHGYYDYIEREFRGFGYAEQKDTDSFNGEGLDQAPVITKTWFHTGAFLDKEKILTQFEQEYFYNQPGIGYKEPQLSDAIADSDLTIQEWREALRACKGMALRVEIFADDDSPSKNIPFTSAQHNCIIERIQPAGKNKYAVFMVHESENISFSYERNAKDARIAHTLNTVFDLYGNILETATVVYGRNKMIADANLEATDLQEQQQSHITYTVNALINKDIITNDDYRLRIPYETDTYELTGYPGPAGILYHPAEVKNIFDTGTEIAYEKKADNINKQKRLIENERHYFRDNVNDVRLSLGDFQSLALPYETYKLAFTLSHATAASDNKITDPLLLQAGYVKIPDAGSAIDNPEKYWVPSGRQQFDTLHFYQVTQATDPFGKPTTIKYDDKYHFYIRETEDAAGNINSVTGFNFVSLAAVKLQDINNNISEIVLDILGIIVGMAIKGKADGTANLDDLDNFNPDLSTAETDLFFADPIPNASALLQHASSRFIYDFSKNNISIATITREKHFTEAANAPIQFSFEYYDGLGKVLQKKVRAEKGDALKSVNGIKTTIPDQDPRWLGSGTIITNNKNNPVKKYEAFFSTTHALEDDDVLQKIGVTPVIHYDPLSRVIRTVFPDGSFSKVEFDPWTQLTYDQNDTVKDSDWYKDRITAPVAGIATPEEIAAANKAFLHHDTPAEAYLDSPGRTFLTLTVSDRTQVSKFRTRIVYDIEGNQQSVIDAAGNTVMEYQYDMLGNKVKQNSMDAAIRITLQDVMGKPVKLWDSKNQEFTNTYDDLRRLLESRVKLAGGVELLFGSILYGEQVPGALTNNLRGKVYKQYDTAGLVQNDVYDAKGNLLATSRSVLKMHMEDADWSKLTDADLEAAIPTEYVYDALARITQSTVNKKNNTRYEFNVGGLLEKVFTTAAGGTETAYVKDIDYNEKGQRNKIIYGNDTFTRYGYDEKTFRLKELVTTDKNGAFLFQDLNYTYDPVGNITEVKDSARQIIYFGNTKVEPVQDYTYDALYQLTKATGREHIGQNISDESNNNKNYRNFPFKGFEAAFPKPTDAVAMRSYTQQFTYDAVGNIKILTHNGSDGTGFTRNYFYNNNDADRVLCAVPAGTIKNNHLLRTQINAGIIDYTYDEHGNMTSMPHLSLMEWNYKDQLKRTEKTLMNDGNPGATYYVYDAAGIRVRKITNLQNTDNKREERIYLTGLELYIKYKDDNTGNAEYKRETVHVMDDKSRVALIETKTEDNGSKDETVTGKEYIRYQYSNHLGSACLELNENLAMISYEEYHPYGTTAYSATDAVINPIAKRYRYTGLERDEENGFGYHNARYYVPWLGRWTAADPRGAIDGNNLYQYTRNKVINSCDPKGTDTKTPLSQDKIKQVLRISDEQILQLQKVGAKPEYFERKVAEAQSSKGIRADPIGNVAQHTDLRGTELLAKAGYVLAVIAVAAPLAVEVLSASSVSSAGATTKIAITTVGSVATTAGTVAATHPEIVDEAENVISAAVKNPQITTQIGRVVETAAPRLLQLEQATEKAPKLLPQFAQSTIDKVVDSANRAASAHLTEGARAIDKKIGHAASKGIDTAFEGIKTTAENAERLIRNILNNPDSSTVFIGKSIDAYNRADAAGQGVRYEEATLKFMGFLEGVLRVR